MFSRRVPGELTPNRLATRVAELRAGGTPILDLTVTNPTAVGLSYPPGLLDALASPSARAYAPEPLGFEEARRAVSADYRRRGAVVPVERLALTASTSEAYGFLFKLLCDPGDEVLVPQPSYPLFEHLTRLEAVTPVPYPLVFTGRWQIDAAALDAATTPRTRAILAVSPNNPTGSLVAPDEASRLVEASATRQSALILDEVFADYLIEPTSSASHTLMSQTEALVFGLGGLSKTIGLPQVKLAWIAAAGPPALAAAAMARLELICDTYLSVGTPVQAAAPHLLQEGAAVREVIRARVRRNLDALAAATAAAPACSLLPVEGGWSALLRVPATRTEDALVLDLLEREHVLVHPGFFYELPYEAFVVVSLLPAHDVFDEGCRRLLGAVS